MGENYIEQIVVCKPSKSAGIEKAALIFLCIASFLFILIPYIGLFLTAAVIAFTVFRFRSYNYEYEYAFVGGELDVDKIIAKSRRKRMASFDFNRMDLVAPVSSQEAMRLEKSGYKTFDYSSHIPDNKVYVAYVMNNNEMIRLLFEPNEDFLKELSHLAPRKVIL